MVEINESNVAVSPVFGGATGATVVLVVVVVPRVDCVNGRRSEETRKHIQIN